MGWLWAFFNWLWEEIIILLLIGYYLEGFDLSCVSCQSSQGSLSAALQDDRADLIEIKGHLEFALLEKHFLREYAALDCKESSYFYSFWQNNDLNLRAVSPMEDSGGLRSRALHHGSDPSWSSTTCPTVRAWLQLSVSEEELRKLKEESNVDLLRQELEKERSRCKELEQKMAMLRSRCLAGRSLM